MIEQIQQLTRPVSTSNTTLQVEISNENDYGHPETEKKRRIKRSKDLKTLSTQSLQPSIAYQFLQPWSPSTCKLEASPSGDCSPASDCSFSDTSSGYASMSTGSSKSSLKGLEELASSMASLPETTIDSKLFLKCVICDTAFETFKDLCSILIPIFENLPFAGPTYTKLSDPPSTQLFGVDTNQGWLKGSEPDAPPPIY
uniref:Uncharacterized protein n=1 Tax=Ditylenchus dipsaci TaxID=166011 RepID=A0A915D210_9BILA